MALATVEDADLADPEVAEEIDRALVFVPDMLGDVRVGGSAKVAPASTHISANARDG